MSLTIDSGREILSQQITSVTGLETQIDGDVELTISLLPQLLVQKIKINNPDGFSDEGLITASEVSVSVSLLALLTGRLHFTAIEAQHARINLVDKKDGSDNWTFDDFTQPSKPDDTTTPDSDSKISIVDRMSVGKFELTNVEIKYRDEEYGLEIHDQLERLVIDMNNRKNPRAELKGKIQGFPYNITFTMDDLELFHSGNPWLLHGEGHIGHRKTKLEASLQSVKKEITGNIDIKIKRVNLGRLLEEMKIVSGQETKINNVVAKAKVRGSDIVELCREADIELHLNKGYWKLPSLGDAEQKELVFSRASAFTRWNKPVKIHLDGHLAGEAIKLNFITNRLSDFFDDMDQLDMDLVSSIVGTKLALKGKLDLPLDTTKFNLDLSVKSDNLGKLNPILNTEFLPFKNFSLAGNLDANGKGFTIKSAVASVGQSQLAASIDIDTRPAKPLWDVNFSSQLLQLNDFAFVDWDIDQTGAASPMEKSDEEVLVELLQALEKRVRDPDMHINLDLQVDKVLSGDDRLGKAQLQLYLRDNEFNLENADIEIPGGRITTSILLETEINNTSGRVKLDIEKLDYGITSRLLDAGSKVDGILSARVDLKLAGRHFTRLLDNATGQLDMVVWPRSRRQAKALNLWATNLFFMILPEINKKESKTNCMVALLDINNGIMKEQLLNFDSTKLWIYGNIEIDFKQEHLKLALFPHSKKAKIFSLEAPVKVAGNFSDIGVVVTPFDVTKSTIAFITSPLFAPMLRIFDDKVPEDGSAICEKLFDRNYTEKLKTEAEQKNQQEVDEILEGY